MDADTWTRLDHLLDEVLDLPPHERLAWVDRLAGADADLAPRLRALLARADSPFHAGFLNTIPRLAFDLGDEIGPADPAAASRALAECLTRLDRVRSR